MNFKIKPITLSVITLLTLPIALTPTVYAAQPIDLSHQHISLLQTFIAAPISAATNPTQMQETSRTIDANQTLHVRMRETYFGHPVWGGDAVLHIPNGANTSNNLTNALALARTKQSTMNGIIYQGIASDLVATPAQALSASQGQKALQAAINLYQHETNKKINIEASSITLIVYLDETSKAHWAFLIKFYVAPVSANDLPAKPTYVLDAASLHRYEKWDDVKTMGVEKVSGGGYGGNPKMGRLIYDGLAKDLPALTIDRNSLFKHCYLENAEVVVKNYDTERTISFPCDITDATHNHVYWDAASDAVNGGYSPSNDALFEGSVIKSMYQQWYGQEVLTQGGKPMLLTMVVHRDIENAYWDGKQMTFGDGGSAFYPLTSLGVAAHEISHGFTQQHSGLTGQTQAGGLNEAFSDMAGEAAKLYAYGSNDYQVGPEILKSTEGALRYMDQPTKDCGGKAPGQDCSIDRLKDYNEYLDVHFSCGIFNRAFYLMSTAPGWDAKKTFRVMMQANMNYWTPMTTFAHAACGVMSAAKDFSYDTKVVAKAFTAVGLDTASC